MRSPWTIDGKVFSVTVDLDSVEAVRTLPQKDEAAGGYQWSEIITAGGLYLPIDLPYPEVMVSMNKAMLHYYGFPHPEGPRRLSEGR